VRQIEVGSRVHYSGDMANDGGWFRVSAVRAGSRPSYDLVEVDGAGRTWRGVFIDPADRYAGHCSPRFVTGEAYDAYIHQQADRSDREVEADALHGSADPEHGSRLDAERVTAEFATKSARRVDAGRKPITDSPLFGGPSQGEMF
jgi:hypothetical protein